MLPHKVLSGTLSPHPCFCTPILPTPSLGFILMTSGHASPSCPEGSAKSCHQLHQQLSTEAASLLPEASAPSAPRLRDTHQLLAREASCRELQHRTPCPGASFQAARGCGQTPNQLSRWAWVRAAKKPCKYMPCLEDRVPVSESLAGWLRMFCRQGNAQLLIHVILL